MKKYLIAGIMCCLLFPLNAQVVNFFTADNPSITIKQNMQINLKEDSKESGVGLSTVVEADFKELYGSAGVNFTNQQYDFTGYLRYGPTFLKKYQLGVSSTYHFYVYPSFFTEQDYLIDAFFNWRPNTVFELFTCYGAFQKRSEILALKDLIPDIKDNGMNFDLRLSFYPDDLWKLYGSFGSYSYFNYPLFFTAFFGTGAEYKLDPDHLSVGVDITAKLYNAIVVAQNISQLNVVIFGKYKI